MEYIAIGLVILQMSTPSCQMTGKSLEHILVPTLDPLDKQMESRIDRLQEYMHNKIMEQNQALGNLQQLSQTTAVLMKKLMQNCRPLFERLKTPDKVEIFLPNRRSNSNHSNNIIKEENTTHRDKTFDKEEDTPIVSIIKYGMNMPKLGKLFLDVISNEFTYQIPNSKVKSSTEAM